MTVALKVVVSNWVTVARIEAGVEAGLRQRLGERLRVRARLRARTRLWPRTRLRAAVHRRVERRPDRHCHRQQRDGRDQHGGADAVLSAGFRVHRRVLSRPHAPTLTNGPLFDVRTPPRGTRLPDPGRRSNAGSPPGPGPSRGSRGARLSPRSCRARPAASTSARSSAAAHRAGQPTARAERAGWRCGCRGGRPCTGRSRSAWSSVPAPRARRSRVNCQFSICASPGKSIDRPPISSSSTRLVLFSASSRSRTSRATECDFCAASRSTTQRTGPGPSDIPCARLTIAGHGARGFAQRGVQRGHPVLGIFLALLRHARILLDGRRTEHRHREPGHDVADGGVGTGVQVSSLCRPRRARRGGRSRRRSSPARPPPPAPPCGARSASRAPRPPAARPPAAARSGPTRGRCRLPRRARRTAGASASAGSSGSSVHGRSTRFGASARRISAASSSAKPNRWSLCRWVTTSTSSAPPVCLLDQLRDVRHAARSASLACLSGRPEVDEQMPLRAAVGQRRVVLDR